MYLVSVIFESEFGGIIGSCLFSISNVEFDMIKCVEDSDFRLYINIKL